ncbi:MAG: leucine-rich repeat protein [Christensenellaceae bacterium]
MSGADGNHRPAGVRKIDKDAFANCRNLTSITLSEGLKEIDSPPFIIV